MPGIGRGKDHIMLQLFSTLKGYRVAASDGRIGTVSDILFDDRSWKLRWLVVDTGTWLPGRMVLIHPSAIGPVDHGTREIGAALSREQVKESPDIRQDEPVSLQMESQLHGYYGWNPVWGGSYPGLGAMAFPLGPSPYFGGGGLREDSHHTPLTTEGDPDLRSAHSVQSYHVHATDGTIGHVENFLIDDADWSIRYLVIDTRNWWPGAHVLLSPHAVKAVSWTDHAITLDVTCAQVKDSPPWKPLDIVDEMYEKRLHTHYEWPGYGW
jgi:sporulation protein YlmC with PRC-barrel domain